MSGAAGATAYRMRWAERRRHRDAVLRGERPARSLARSRRRVRLPDRLHAVVRRSVPRRGRRCSSTAATSSTSRSQHRRASSIIATRTLSIYGRSYNTTASGSFNWQTFDGIGATADELRQQRRAVPVVLGRHDDRDLARRQRRAAPHQGGPVVGLARRQPHRALPRRAVAAWTSFQRQQQSGDR